MFLIRILFFAILLISNIKVYGNLNGSILFVVIVILSVFFVIDFKDKYK